MSELQTLAQDCKYIEMLEDKWRDCLVYGINNKVIQRSLLAEPKLTLEKALKLFQSTETVVQNMQEMRVKFGDELHKREKLVRWETKTSEQWTCQDNVYLLRVVKLTTRPTLLKAGGGMSRLPTPTKLVEEEESDSSEHTLCQISFTDLGKPLKVDVIISG